MPPTLLAGTASQAIWAADVTDADGISNVWCVVTEPAYTGGAPLPQVDLAYSAASNRYEALLTGLTNPGTYTLTFYATDTKGVLSEAVQSELVIADAYEGDDQLSDETLYFGPAQFHNFHSTGDVDWVKFYAVSNYAYEISTFHFDTNVDTVISLYREENSGSLTLLDLVDDFGRDEGELVGLDFPADGFYAVQVSQYVTNGWQPGSYELDVTIPAGGGPLIVHAFNKLTGGVLPPGSTAQAGSQSVAFGGLPSITFSNLPAGATTVSIQNLPLGYRLAEATNAPGQVGDPSNVMFGNPRNVAVSPDNRSVAWALFSIVPTFAVQGRALDAWTGEPLAGAKIEFIGPSNIVYQSYPNAFYQSPWYTGGEGAFPTNVILPTFGMNLRLIRAGYSNYVAASALVSPLVGTTNNLGQRYLTPLDTNGNQVADCWEVLYFGTNIATGTMDSDADGQNDQAEYWAGTDPTNAANVFRSDQAELTNGITLRWPVSAGRTYGVQTTLVLGTSLWSTVGGPWTAAVGQTTMKWTEAAPGATGRYYRVRLETR